MITAPITVVSILIFANPCVVMNGFIPITISTKNTSKDVDAGIGNGIRKCLTTCTEKGQHLWGKNKENKGQYNCHDNKKRKAVPKDLFCSPVILFPHGNRGTRSTSRTGKHGKCIDQH